MPDKFKLILKSILYELICAAVFIYSVVPGFNNIGHLCYQIVITAVIILIFLLVADPWKIKPSVVSHSLIIMTSFWFFTAVIEQIKLHLQTNDTTLSWRHLFYYDKPAMLIVVYFSAFLFFALKLINHFQDKAFIKQYKKFLKTALISFVVYYLLIIFYCFFLVRAGGDIKSEVNFIPFNVFNVMKAGEYEYEFIFLFFGNIGIFLPLGFLISALIKNKPVIIIIPFVLSVGIEISQYFLKNGQPDIDDVILNVLGYFLGYLAKLLLDKIISKASKGRLNSIFII